MTVVGHKVFINILKLNLAYILSVQFFIGKFYGPRIGALYARNCLEIKNEFRKSPIFNPLFGASQENGFRPGTENTPMIIGLGKAAQLVTNNLPRFTFHMRDMRNYLETRLTVSGFSEVSLTNNFFSSFL